MTESVRAVATRPLVAPLTHLLLAASCCSCLVACDQASPEMAAGTDGTGGGMIDEAMLSGVTVEDDTFPVVPGSTWVYQHRGGDEPWEETVTLSEETVEGRASLVLRDTPGPSGTFSESVLEVQDHVVFRVDKRVFIGAVMQSRSNYDPGFARHDLRWGLRAANHSELREYDRKEWDEDGQLVRDGQRAHRFTIEETSASVTVPAGSFEGCVVVLRERQRTSPADITESDNKRFWYCPGIGKVKELERATGKTEELTSCSVPGGRCP